MFHSNIEWQNHAQVSTQLNKMMDKLFFTLNVIKTILNNANAPQNCLTKLRTNPYEEYDDREFTKRLSKPCRPLWRVQFHWHYCILNVDLTGSFCCDFDIRFALQL